MLIMAEISDDYCYIGESSEPRSKKEYMRLIRRLNGDLIIVNDIFQRLPVGDIISYINWHEDYEICTFCKYKVENAHGGEFITLYGSLIMVKSFLDKIRFFYRDKPLSEIVLERTISPNGFRDESIAITFRWFDLYYFFNGYLNKAIEEMIATVWENYNESDIAYWE